MFRWVRLRFPVWTLDARKDDFLPSAQGASIVRGGVIEVDLFDVTRERVTGILRRAAPPRQHARCSSIISTSITFHFEAKNRLLDVESSRESRRIFASFVDVVQKVCRLGNFQDEYFHFAMLYRERVRIPFVREVFQFLTLDRWNSKRNVLSVRVK